MAKHATKEEFNEAFDRLTQIERLGLKEAARRYASGHSGYTCGDDLLSEAVFRALDGRRKWRSGVPLETFLANVMRSVVSGARQRIEMTNRFLSLDADEDSGDGRLWRDAARAHPSAEDEAMRGQRARLGARAVAYAERSLRGDHDALNVLGGIVSGMAPNEIRQRHGMDKLRYAAAKQRVTFRLRACAQGSRP